MYLLFDTETTGLLHEDPHLVQLAALLVDSDYQTAGEMNVIIKPDGWIVPDHLAALHGISTEKALRYGIPISAALSVFESLERQAYILVAHNIQFDDGVVNLEYKRLGWTRCFSPRRRFCTMLESKNLVRLPPIRGYGDFKWPKLIEAHHHFFGEGFTGEHDARADLQACLRIFKHLQEIKSRSPFSIGSEAILRWMKKMIQK